MNKYIKYIFLFVLLISNYSFAQYVAPDTVDYKVLDRVMNAYMPLQMQWHGAILGFAKSLFWGLASVDIIWMFITFAKDRKELGEMAMGMMNKFVTLGFFYALLLFSGKWLPDIIASFVKIGSAACSTSGGSCASLTPDGVLVFGYKLALAMIGQALGMAKITEPTTLLILLFVIFIAMLVLFSFLIVAGQLLITLIESYLVIGGGVILLGFGGSRWTSDMASSYLKSAVGTGVKILMLYLIIGAGQTIFSDLKIVNTAIAIDLITQSASLFVQAFIYAFLAWSAPSLASSILSGAPSSTLGGVIGAGITAGAAMAGAAGVGKNLASSGAGAAVGAKNRAQGTLAGLSSWSNGRDAGMGKEAATSNSAPLATQSFSSRNTAKSQPPSDINDSNQADSKESNKSAADVESQKVEENGSADQSQDGTADQAQTKGNVSGKPAAVEQSRNELMNPIVANDKFGDALLGGNVSANNASQRLNAPKTGFPKNFDQLQTEIRANPQTQASRITPAETSKNTGAATIPGRTVEANNNQASAVPTMLGQSAQLATNEPVTVNDAKGASTPASQPASSGAPSQVQNQRKSTGTQEAQAPVAPSNTPRSQATSPGDASLAEISGVSSARQNLSDLIRGKGPDNTAHAQPVSWSDKIKGLEKFVHQDAAQVQTHGFSLTHGKD